MSALGEISKRLKTDIGETARAAIDPVFSQQLTQDRFRQAELSKKRQQQLADREEQRQQQLADEERQMRSRLQLAGIEKAFQHSQDTNDWKPWASFVSTMDDNPNLNPLMRDYAVSLNKMQGSKSIDRLKLEHQWQKDFDTKTLNYKKFLFEQTKEWTDQQQWEAEQIIREDKLMLDQMKDLRETNESRNNHYQMIKFIENTPDILTEAERTSYLIRLKDETGAEAVNKVWDEIMARKAARIDNTERMARAKISGKSGPITTSPTRLEVSFAAESAKENFPEFDSMDEKSQNKMVQFIAMVMHKEARDNKLSQPDALAVAISRAKTGIGEDGDWISPDPIFNIGRATSGLPPGYSESYVEETMKLNPDASRDEVLNQLWLQYNKTVDE